MADDMGEKTEMPTGRKLSEARNKGQVAKSQDLTAAVDLVGVLIVLVVLGGVVFRAMKGTMREGLTSMGEGLTGPEVMAIIKNAVVGPTLAVAPIAGILLMVAVGAHVMQFGWLWTYQPLQPKIERLNPIAGAKRLVDRRAAVRTLTSLTKLVVIGVVAVAYTRSVAGEVAGLPRLELLAAFMRLGELALNLAMLLIALLLLIGLADFMYQKWQHTQDLKMTKHEVEDERRSMDGDPEIKRKRLMMARQIALHQIGTNVPKADVVVTNPTHFSVAIRYDQATMRAPRVVAKGADELAFKIRELARSNGVPVIERPPLARALFWGVDVGREIDPEFYQAVAEVLAMVYRLKPRDASGGDERTTMGRAGVGTAGAAA